MKDKHVYDVRNSLDEEFDRKEPREAAEGQMVLTARADAVVDLRDVRRDVLHTRIIQTVDPQTRILTLHRSVQSVKHTRRVLTNKHTSSSHNTSSNHRSQWNV